MQNASANLITALKNSLADSGDGWEVVNVSEASGTRITSVTPSVTGATFLQPGFGNPTATAVTSVSVAANSSTTVITQIDMTASPLRVAVGSTTPMALTYLSVWVAGVYSAGQIYADGAQWATSDSALDTTIRALATTFLTAKDTSLKDALNAGPVAASEDPLLIPEDLLAALLTTLADDTWVARSRSEFVQGDNAARVTKVVVSLSAPLVETADGTDYEPYVRLQPDSTAPGQIGYEATYDSLGELIEASVRLNSAQWRTGLDTELDTAIMALADDFIATQSESLTTAFEAGAQ